MKVFTGFFNLLQKIFRYFRYLNRLVNVGNTKRVSDKDFKELSQNSLISAS